MNQILFNKKENSKLKYIFKVQFVISIIVIIVLIIIFFLKQNKEKKLEEISKIINKNIEIINIYNTQKINIETSKYLGKINIKKIDLEYSVFKEIDDELLKISPCRFYGPEFGKKGNICIAGHNYNNNLFFSRLDEIKINDKILLTNLKGDTFEYIVFNVFETDENDVTVFKSTKNYELTLLTCNNSNKKRIIIKAYKKEY